MKNFSKPITWFMPTPAPDILSNSSNSELLNGCELFSSGRDAIFRIINLEKIISPRRLFLPEYFCPSIVRVLSDMCDVVLYKDYPSEKQPRCNCISANIGDVVLVANFFGIRKKEVWDNWFENNKGVVRIDDISHTPFSDWFFNSTADYIFASLRKSLPLPDGAYLKIKNKNPAKIFKTYGDMPAFSADIVSAMSLNNIFNYDKALDLYYSGEAKLNAKKSFSRISRYSFEILKHLDTDKIADKTLENLIAFCDNLKENQPFKELNILNNNLKIAKNVFAPTLIFEDMKTRDIFHNHLVRNGVMPSIYWGGLGDRVSIDAHKQSDTIFTIPLDFRHTKEDAVQVAKIISSINL